MTYELPEGARHLGAVSDGDFVQFSAPIGSDDCWLVDGGKYQLIAIPVDEPELTLAEKIAEWLTLRHFKVSDVALTDLPYWMGRMVDELGLVESTGYEYCMDPESHDDPVTAERTRWDNFQRPVAYGDWERITEEWEG